MLSHVFTLRQAQDRRRMPASPHGWLLGLYSPTSFPNQHRKSTQLMSSWWRWIFKCKSRYYIIWEQALLKYRKRAKPILLKNTWPQMGLGEISLSLSYIKSPSAAWHSLDSNHYRSIMHAWSQTWLSSLPLRMLNGLGRFRIRPFKPGTGLNNP